MTLASTDPTAPKIYLTSTDELTGLQGFVNCLKQEPGGHVIRSVLGGPHDDKIFAAIQKADLISNIVKKGVVGTYRHRPLAEQSETTAVKHAYINTLTRGDLSSLRWIESDLKYTPDAPNTELCTVEYAPLNFRDIMLATGKLPPDALPGNLAMQDCVLGLEFAGRNKANKRVMGLVDAKGLATHVLADPTFMWEVPDKWTMEEAATVPVCYATAYYALVVRGQLKPKETVLIHSGSGGVGQAAISIALSMNCTVFTTVGSNDKKTAVEKSFSRHARMELCKLT
jgi:fatty acid synthase